MKKILILTLSFLSSFSIFSQKLYQIDKIQKIEIKFDFDNWDALMDAAAASPADGYTVALWCKINGVKYDSVGVKFKGNSSYKASNKKNPLHIELNYIKKNQDYKGYTDLKLSSGALDPAFIREALSYQIVRDYMDAPDANFTNVYINDKKYGFFTNVQNVNKVFIEQSFGESKGVFVKCTPAAGAGGAGGLTGYCTLKYLGKDSSLYKTKYDMKTVGGFASLINACDTITNNPKAIEKVIDVNRSLWMLAYNNLFSNYDSYTGTFCQNYYLYKDKTGRFLPIIWDLNMSFGGFNLGGGGAGSDLSKTALYYQNTNNERPLIKSLLNNPTYKKMYVAHIKTMIDDWVANGKYLTVGKEMQGIADTAYQADPNKIFTYSQFQSGLTAAAAGGGPGSSTSAPKTLMENRLTYLKTLVEFQKTAPSISVDKISATINEPVNIKATIKNADTAWVNYRYEFGDIFKKIPLFNDGKHNDGEANDSIWATSLTIEKPELQYYIYAQNNDAGTFSPRAVEKNYHTILAKSPNSIAPGELVVNEIMANNKTAVKAPSGKFSDWFELYNTTNKEIDLSNVALSDNFTLTKKYVFPVGSKIKGNTYLIVWADDGDAGPGYHALFKLADNGERFILSDPNGVVLDSLSFNNQKADYSFARCPNATGKFVITNHTFGISNGNCKEVKVGTNDLILSELSVFPNPTNDILFIKNEKSPLGKVIVYDLLGKILMSQKFNESEAIMDLSNLPKGMYLIKADATKIVKIVKE